MRVGWKQTIEGTCTPFTHGGPLPPNSLQLPTLLEACAGRDTLFLFSHSLMMHQESLKLEIQFLVLKQWYTCWDSGFGRSQPQGSQGHVGRGQSPSIRQREWLEKKKKSKKVGRGPTTDRRAPRKKSLPRLGSGRLWQMSRFRGRHLGPLLSPDQKALSSSQHRTV